MSTRKRRSNVEPRLPGPYTVDSLPDSSSLSDLSGIRGTRLIPYAFYRQLSVGIDGMYWPVDGCMINLLRLSDHAVDSWEAARGQIGLLVAAQADARPGMVAGEGYSAIVRTANHLETAIESLHRAFENKSQLLGDPEIEAAFPVGRFPSRRVEGNIERFRHAISHRDQKIANGRWDGAGPAFVVPRRDTMVLGSEELSYAELGEAIRRTAEGSSELAELLVNGPNVRSPEN